MGRVGHTHTHTLALVALLASACNGDSDARIDANRPPIDASPPPSGDARLGADCKGELCTIEQSCCSDFLNDPPMHVTFCLPTADLCEGAAFDCDGPEDCESETCCSPGDGHVQCVDAGACDGYRACHFDEDCRGPERCCDTQVGVIRVCLTGCSG